MSIVTISKVNEVYIKVTSDAHVERELYELFKFHLPESKYINRKRNTRWDGYIHLYSLKTKQIYLGLLQDVIDYCKEADYTVNNTVEMNGIALTDEMVERFVNMLKLSKDPRDYQIAAFKDCVALGRNLTVSPTGSGKSLLIYMLSRFYTSIDPAGKILIIVPTTGLVHQMADDFISYGCDESIHRISAGVVKTTDDKYVVSTWQSLQTTDPNWFNQFTCVVFDEAHLCKAKVLTHIITSMKNCRYRFGLTGTLDNVHVNQLVLQGLFYRQNKVITTSELINRKQLADLDIKILVLQHNKEHAKVLSKLTYQDEIQYLISSAERNNFIRNLVCSLKGNTLVLYDRVDTHGQLIFDAVKQINPNSFFIHGGVDGTERNKIRSIVEQSNDAVIIASYGVFSTGVSIVNLHNVVYASPTKSKIRNLQSIGRGLRISKDKTTATLYDIADDLTYKNKRNYTFNHLFERVKNYNAEQFQYRTYTIPLSQ